MEHTGDFEPRPGFVESIKAAFTSPKEYERFRRVKTMSAVGFLALLIFLSVLIGSLFITFKISGTLDELAEYYKKELPEIRIKDGKVETDAKMPFIHRISEGKSGEYVIIIDTTGKIKNMDDYSQGILLTESEIFNKRSRYNVQRNDLSQVKSFTLNKDVILQWKSKLPVYLLPVLMIFGLMWEGFKMLILVPLMAFASKTISTGQANYPFGQYVNIAIYAAAPAIIIMTPVNLFLMSIPGIIRSLAFFGIYLYFVFFGTNGMLSAAGNLPTPAGESLGDVSDLNHP